MMCLDYTNPFRPDGPKSGKGCVNLPLLNLKAPAVDGNIAVSINTATPTKEVQGVEHSQTIRYAVANK
ncbi:hypothetical protein [Enterobacter ludwigii]